MLNLDSPEKNPDLNLNYIHLLNSLILSLNSSPLKSLQELSNESTLYSLIIEIEPNFETTPINNFIEINPSEDIITRQKNFKNIFTSMEKYANESKTKDNFTKETLFNSTISINSLINNEIFELIKVAEMLIFLTIISSNKNYYIEKVNEIEDNKISKLYYQIIEKYIFFKIDESTINVKKSNSNIMPSNQKYNVKTIKIKKNKFKLRENQEVYLNSILLREYEKLENKKEENTDSKIYEKSHINYNEENEKKIENLNKEITELKEKLENYEKEKQLLEQNLNEEKQKNININNSKKLFENLIISEQISLESQSTINTEKDKKEKETKELIESLRKENENLQKTIENLNIEKNDLLSKAEQANTNIKELELDYEKLKEEFEIKEHNSAEIISNNKEINEKLSNDLKIEIDKNNNMNEQNEKMKIELDKYKEELNEYKKKINEKKEIEAEIDTMKKILEIKEEEIKELKEKNNLYEIEKEKDKEKEEYANYYKKSYEEQKIRVNEEHKLISESLYKLAIHFMTLKDDLQKRINAANNDK